MSRLTEDNIDKAVELLARGHDSHLLQMSKFSKRKVGAEIRRYIDDVRFLLLVNKDVSAILILHSIPPFFSTQPQISSLAFYSETAGAGFRLLKEAEVWVKGWGEGVGLATIHNSGSDKVSEMLERFGMEKVVSTYKFSQGDKT